MLFTIATTKSKFAAALIPSPAVFSSIEMAADGRLRHWDHVFDTLCAPLNVPIFCLYCTPTYVLSFVSGSVQMVTLDFHETLAYWFHFKIALSCPIWSASAIVRGRKPRAIRKRTTQRNNKSFGFQVIRRIETKPKVRGGHGGCMDHTQGWPWFASCVNPKVGVAFLFLFLNCWLLFK